MTMKDQWGTAYLFSLILMALAVGHHMQQEAVAGSSQTTLVSVSSNGEQGNEWAGDPAITADGRFVVFSSKATNLVPEAVWPGVTNLYIHDRQTKSTSLVTVGVNGTPSYGHSDAPDISADGRFIAFASSSPNLVPGDTNQGFDIFVHDRQTNSTRRVSVSSAGTQANDASLAPTISADGRYVAFQSWASNLVEGDTAICPDHVFGGTMNCIDVFVHDLQNGTTGRVTNGKDGAQSNDNSLKPSISADGRYVTFESQASNLVDNDTAVCVDSYEGEVSCTDIFVYDRQTGATSLVSVASNGAPADRGSHHPSISADGNFVAFMSTAKNLTVNDKEWLNVYVHDRSTGNTTCVSLAHNDAFISHNIRSLSISDNGQYVAFVSNAPNLVVGDSNNSFDIFLHDRYSAALSRVSVDSSGIEGNDHSFSEAISADGSFIAFHSHATNLVESDTNGVLDTFVHATESTLVPAPIITAITPLSGTVGTPVKIDGVNLSGATSVKFNGMAADFTMISSAHINTSVPIGATTGKITVTTSGGTATSPSSFTVIQNLSDFTIDSVEPIQVLEGQKLVRGKDTAVKVVVRQSGTAGADNLLVHLDVGSFFLNQFHVYEPGNLDEHHSLRDDNSIYPLNFSPEDTIKTIYFFSDYLRPTGDEFSVTAIVNPFGDVAELDTTNNSREMTEPAKVYQTKWSGLLYPTLDIRFYRIDDVNLSTYSQYAEQSAAFARDMYPVANDRFSKTINGSLWWTSVPDNVKCVGEGVAPESQGRVNSWALVVSSALTVAEPTTDRFVLISDDVPCGYGLHFPGTPLILVNSWQLKTMPHELGHSYSLQHPTSESQQVIDSAGLWVSQKRPMVQSDQRKIYNFMKGGVGPESWITSTNYEILFNDHDPDISTDPPLARVANKVIVATGYAELSGSFDLQDWYIIDDADTSNLALGPYTFEYINATGEVIHEQSFGLSFTINDTQYESVPFVIKIPYLDGTSAINVKNNDIIRVTKYRSLRAPIVEISQPVIGETYTSSLHIAWESTDDDSDDLRFMVLVSSDNGEEWQTIAHGLQSTTYTWDLDQALPGTAYLIKVIATDGFNSSEDVLDNPIFVESKIFSPIVVR